MTRPRGPKPATVDRLVEIDHLAGAGETAERIASRVGMTVAALDKTLRRNGRAALALSLHTAAATKRAATRNRKDQS